MKLKAPVSSSFREVNTVYENGPYTVGPTVNTTVWGQGIFKSSLQSASIISCVYIIFSVAGRQVDSNCTVSFVSSIEFV